MSIERVANDMHRIRKEQLARQGRREETLETLDGDEGREALERRDKELETLYAEAQEELAELLEREA